MHPDHNNPYPHVVQTPDANLFGQSDQGPEMLNAALELLDQGLSIMPVARDKKPLLAWAELQKRLPSIEEVESWWERWPEANLGIITGAISGIWVVDADNPDAQAWIVENMPPTSLYVKTGRGGHAYYRLPRGVVVANRAGWAPGVDVRGEGGYVVAPPSLHENGAAYEWRVPDGFEGWEDLPEYAPEFARSGSSGGNLEIDLSGVLPDPLSVSVAEQGGRNNALHRYASSRANNNLTFGELLALCEAWNRRVCKPPLGARELARTVKSAYEKHIQNHPEATEVETPGEPAQIELPESEAENTFPAELMPEKGLLADIVRYIEQSSAASHPQFCLAAAIALVGALAGQRVMTETGLRTNFYMVCLGYSGSGKDAANGAVPEILTNCGPAYQVLGPTKLSSDSALLAHLDGRETDIYQSPKSTLMLWDEFGLLLKALQKPASHAANLPALLMELFSATNRPYHKAYADKAASIHLPWHHVSLVASSTPSSFWQSLGSSDTTSGFLARLLVWESRHDAPLPKKRVWKPVPKVLSRALEDLFGLKVPLDNSQGNLMTRPAPLMVGKTKEADAAFDEWAKGYHDLRNKHKDSELGLDSIYGRAAEHAHKLALVSAVARLGCQVVNNRVGIQDVQWAMALVDRLVGDLIKGVEANIADSEFQRKCQKIEKLIRRKATKERPGLALWEIGLYSHIAKDELAKLIESMTTYGQLILREHKGKRGPATYIYCLRKQS